MNIVFTSVLYGGLDSYIWATGQWLIKNGHTVHIIYLGNSQVIREIDPLLGPHIHHVTVGQIHYYLARLGFRNITHQVRLWEWSNAVSRRVKEISQIYRLDLAEFHEGISYPRLFSDFPFILKTHGSEWIIRAYCEDGPVFRTLATHQRQMMLQSQQVHSLSHSLADYISGACNFPRRLIRVTPYSIETNQFQPEANRNYSAPYHIMCVGRLEKRKGTHTLISAMLKVWEKLPDVHLHFFGGEGDFGSDQISKIMPPEIHLGRLHIEGFIPRERLIDQYHKSALYVAPTRYETFGYTLLEALSCGCPIIATDIGAVPELIHHNETGWLFERDNMNELAEMIIHVLKEPKERMRVSITGVNFARNFDSSIIMPRQIELYEQVIQTVPSY
jgi:glycogen(starch) synthase